MSTPTASKDGQSAAASVAVGDLIDERYEIEQLLGEGGMGAVFAASDGAEDRRVALKVMLPSESEKEDSARRFLREARAARTIDSPHVARVMRVGKLSTGTPYMVMELLDGRSLDKVIREEAPLPEATAVDYLLQACEGVAAAHALGIIHRDLKPSNLHLADDGESPTVKVLDFGIAKATVQLDPNTDNVSLTESSSTLGSPQYMSPEQLRSAKDVDARTDIWSLGLILHKMLTGRSAFEAENVGAQFAMIISEPPTPLRQHRDGVARELEEVILCCLQKSVVSRYQDVGQLAEALLPFAAEQSAERVARIRRLLDDADASASALPAPPSSSAPSIDALAPTVAIDSSAGGMGDTTAATRATSRSAARPAVRHGSRNIVLMVAAVLAAGAIAYGMLRDHPPAQESIAAATDTDRHGAENEDADETASPPKESPEDATVAIRLTLTPPDALVELDGVLRSANPIRLRRSERTHELVVSAPGYVTDRRQLTAAEDAEMTVELRRRVAPGRAQPRPVPTQPTPSPPTTDTSTPAPPPATTAPPPPPASTPKLTPKGPIEDTL